MTVKGTLVSGASYTGGIIGNYQRATSLTGFYSDITSVSGTSYTGGILGSGRGDVYPGVFDINNASSRIGTLTGRGDYVAGVCGWVANGSTGVSVFNRASTIITNKIDSNSSYVGGIVGGGSWKININDSNVDLNYISINGGDVFVVGGIAGGIDGNIVNSFALVDNIDFNKNSGTVAKVGGIGGAVGGSAGYGFIVNSWADVNINASIGTYTGDYIGGLAGIAYGGIINSYSRGNYIIANKLERDYIGGLAGEVRGILADSNSIYSDINGGTGSYVGGLIGSSAATKIYNNYSMISTLTGGSYTGGLIGNCRGDASSGVFDINNSNSRIETLTARGDNAGGVCGWAGNGYTGISAFNRCSTIITNKIDSTASYVGGIVGGSSWKVNITDSNVDVNYITINGGDVFVVGGIAGVIDGNIVNSFALVDNIDFNKNSGTLAKVGGLAGYVGSSSGSGFLINCYFNGNINAAIGSVSGNYVGGLAGFASGNVLNSYSSGSYILAGKSSAGFVGGLIGRAQGQVMDSNSTYTDINGGAGDKVGGLVGSYYATNFSGYNYTRNLFATVGTISGGSYTGGLIGELMNYGAVQFDFNDSHAIVGTINSRGTGGYVGGLIGSAANYAGVAYRINNCYSIISNKIEVNSSTGSYVGGLIGSTSYTKNMIYNSYADVNYIRVNGSDVYYIAGLVGNIDGNIYNSYALVDNIDINKNSGASVRAGGIVGFAGSGAGNGYLTNCYADVNINVAIGSVSGTYIGGLAGIAYGGIIGSTSRGNFILANKTSSGYVGGLAGRVQGGMIDSNSVYNDINAGTGSYVGGLVGSCYATSSSTYNYANNLSSTINTITGGGNVGGLAGEVIGYNTTQFDFNNSRSTIGTIKASGQYVGGLLGYMGTYNNLNFAMNNCSSIVTNKIEAIGSNLSYLGGLVGSSVQATKHNIYNSNADINYIYVYATGYPGSTTFHVAGLIGYIDGNIFNSYALVDNIDVNQVSGRIGGLVGTSMGAITNSWADVNINNSLGTFSGADIGGLGGLVAKDVNNCYSSGNFILANKTSGNEIGGLIGWSSNAGKTYNSYSSIQTINAGTNTKVGGLIGIGSSNIVNSFSTSTVTAGSSYGPICGTGCTPITHTCYLSSTNVICYPTDANSLGAGSTYFKGNSTNNPLSYWSFYNSQSNPNGVWYIWANDYPHLSASPIVTYYTSGTFISKKINLGGAKKFTTLDLNMLKPTDTNIEVQIRTANSEADLNTAPWLGPNGGSDSNYILSTQDINFIHDGNSWVQYKATLSTTNTSSTPKLYDVNIHTLAFGEAIYSKTGTAFSWISFSPPVDSNGCTLNWFYSLSNSPYSWVSTSGELIGNDNLWLKLLISGTNDSNNLQIGNFDLTYSE